MSYTHFFVVGDRRFISFFKKHSLSSLISYANSRNLIKDVVDSYKENHNGKLILDSGAFSVATKGIKIKDEDYLEYVKENYNNFDIIAQLDTINYGKVDSFTSAEKTYKNACYMLENLKDTERLALVFHSDEDYTALKRLLNLKINNKKAGYLMLGVGSMGNGHPRFLVPHLYQIWDIIKNSNNPDIKVHLLGVSYMPVLESVPCYSSDGSSWLRFSGLGRVVFYDGDNICKIINFAKRTVRVSDLYHKLNKQQRYFIDKRLDELGYTIDDLYNNTIKRTEFNLLNWKMLYENYKLRYEPLKSNLLF